MHSDSVSGCSQFPCLYPGNRSLPGFDLIAPVLTLTLTRFTFLPMSRNAMQVKEPYQLGKRKFKVNWNAYKAAAEGLREKKKPKAGQSHGGNLRRLLTSPLLLAVACGLGCRMSVWISAAHLLCGWAEGPGCMCRLESSRVNRENLIPVLEERAHC